MADIGSETRFATGKFKYAGSASSYIVINCITTAVTAIDIEHITKLEDKVIIMIVIDKVMVVTESYYCN